jgi:hypothetical protein
MHLRLPKLGEEKGVEKKFPSQSNNKVPETLLGGESPQATPSKEYCISGNLHVDRERVAAIN